MGFFSRIVRLGVGIIRKKTSHHAAETDAHADRTPETSSKDSPAHEVTAPTQPEKQRLSKDDSPSIERRDVSQDDMTKTRTKVKRTL